jgi:hypothetical protein
MEPTWLALLELVLDSTLKLLEVEEERVVMGEGVNFFCRPFRMCWLFTDIVIYLLLVPFLVLSSSSCNLMQ